MTKARTKYVGTRLPEELVAKIDAISDNRTEVIEQALLEYLGRAPTEKEVAAALSIVFRAAKTRQGEEVHP
jgi:metal-responsive CopG/Arc/MetJ family transcriptional regulator